MKEPDWEMVFTPPEVRAELTKDAIAEQKALRAKFLSKANGK